MAHHDHGIHTYGSYGIRETPTTSFCITPLDMHMNMTIHDICNTFGTHMIPSAHTRPYVYVVHHILVILLDEVGLGPQRRLPVCTKRCCQTESA